MHTRSILLFVALAACHPASAPVIAGSAASNAAPIADTRPARAKPLATVDGPQRARTMRIAADDSASVFGLVWHDVGWAIGIAFTDDRRSVELHPIGSDGVGIASHTVDIHEGFPNALVAGAHAKDSPWVIVEANDRDFTPTGRFVAHAFDGQQHTALALPSGDPGIRESSVRTAWKRGEVPSGAAAWSTSLVRKLSDAELEKIRRGDSRGAPKSSSTSPYRTLGHTARYYGGGSKSFEALRVKNGVVDLGWYAVAVGEHGWVGAHWAAKRTDAEPQWSIALAWFERDTKLARKQTIAAPPRTSGGQLAIAGDGTTYLVTDRSSPFDTDPALVVLTFDADGTRTDDRTIAMPGWVADSMATFTCNGRTWLAIDPYAQGNEMVDVIELVPSGPLSAQRLWSARDPEAVASEGSRPGRVVYSACGPDRAAIAFQLRIATSGDAKPEVAPAILLAQWES